MKERKTNREKKTQDREDNEVGTVAEGSVSQNIKTEVKPSLAEIKKAEANVFYEAGKYAEALPLYTDAVNHCPENATLYLNRAACYVMLHNHRLALEDCQETLKRDSRNIKALIRESKCHMSLGDPAAALRSLMRVKLLGPGNQTLSNDIRTAEALQDIVTKGDNAYAKKDFKEVVRLMDCALTLNPGCVKFRLLKAECLAHTHRLIDARDIASDVNRSRSGTKDAGAFFVLGLVRYYDGNMDEAFEQFEQVFQLDADHEKTGSVYKKAKVFKQQKKFGDERYKAGDIEEAYKTYTDLLRVDPFNILINAKLHVNRAQCYIRQHKLYEAIEDCSKAIELDPTLIRAYLSRAKCYQDLGMHREAVIEYANAFLKEKTYENQKLLLDAKLKFVEGLRKDYYKILGVGKKATQSQIKTAYKKRALIHHPDRHSHASEDVRREQGKIFQDIGEAYDVLADEDKKYRYDNGFDIDISDY